VGTIDVGGRRKRRTSVRQRLALVVLLPVAILAALGTTTGLHTRRQLARAVAVEGQIEHADRILAVKLALADELYAAGAVQAAQELGVDLPSLAAIAEYDPLAAVSSQRRVLEERVEATGDRAVRELVDAIAGVRSDTDERRSDLPRLFRTSARIQHGLSRLANDALRQAEDAAAGVSRSTELRRAAAAVRGAVDVSSAIAAEMDSLARLLVVGGGDPSAVDLLRSTRVRADLAADRMGELVTPAVAPAWHAAERAAGTVELRSLVARYAAMSPEQIPSLGMGPLVESFLRTTPSLDAHEAVAEHAAAAALDAASDLRARASRELTLTIVIILGTCALALGSTVVLARSIGLPLAALSARAAAVKDGQWADDGPPLRGPHELVGVAATFEELVDNLRVVEAQLGALAGGALSDPVLDVPVPGRLGNLLHDSVLRLSRSIAERELLAQRLEHEATHDALTGLPNRDSLVGELGTALAEERDAAVLIVDLDGFKPVNETHGHEAGDRLLRVTADRLRSHLGPDDVVARIGGDEFALLVHGADVEELAGRIIRHVASPVRVGAVVTQVRASVGVAVAPPGAWQDAEELLRQAGLAATAAKANGGGAVERCDAAMLAEVVRRADIESRLRRALADGDLVLQFQPVVDGALVADGAEALIRWRQPDGSLLPPGLFIPVAEASDLIVDIGRWVLREACQLLAYWTDDPALGSLRLSVNLSARHVLSLTVVDDVRASLEEAGVDPSRLCLEVTETMVLTDLPIATDHLRRLRELGVTIAIDDFGTGYTSLGHLRELPVDVIKIDRSLVVAAAAGEADRRVVELVVGAAHAMGLLVVAEGIETVHQLEVLLTAGCDRFQGYLVSRPGPVEVLKVPTAVPVQTS
jgi:diguanylate cyclase (GGDEF)-like protein